MLPTKRPIVLAGPSGSGKSTLINKLMAEFPSSFGFSVSHTTRSIRPSEVNGVNYHFVTREFMEKQVAEGKFIEHAIYSGNMYGTSIQAVQDVIQSGKVCLLDIDMQGVINVKKTNLNPYYIFVSPPSMEELERRLRNRGDTDEEAIQKRLETAKREMQCRDKEGFWDLVLINKDLEKTYSELRSFVTERYSL